VELSLYHSEQFVGEESRLTSPKVPGQGDHVCHIVLNGHYVCIRINLKPSNFTRDFGGRSIISIGFLPYVSYLACHPNFVCSFSLP